MEKKNSTHKLSKTPGKTIATCLSDESKESQVDVESGSFQLCEGISSPYVPDRLILHQEEWVSSEQDSVSYLKFEIQTKQQLIDEITLTQDELKQTLSTLKAKNNSLHNELNTCRNRNYDLDVEIYLLKVSMKDKEKEFQRVIYENECYKANENKYRGLVEENSRLAEELKTSKGKFQARLKKGSQKIDELLKSLKEANIYIASLKQQNDSDFLLKNNSKSIEKRKSSTKLKIPLKSPEKSPERHLNMTDRGVHGPSSLLTDIMRILSLESPNKILSSVLHLYESHKSQRKYKAFFQKMSNLVTECSPPGFYKTHPTIGEVWKWVTTFLDEYMKMRQSIE